MRAKPLAAIVFLVIALGLSVEAFAPPLRAAVAMFAAFCGVATWVAPGLALLVVPRPRTSLGAVGFTISLAATAAILSALGLSLAVGALFAGAGVSWARFALAAIAAFWTLLAIAAALYNPRRASRARSSKNRT